jgi:type IV secretory pathway VirJ component
MIRRWSAVAIALLCTAFYWLGYFGGQDISDFPATVAAPPARRGLAAIVISGDMGLAFGMGHDVAHALAADGIPVIGVNSLSFFRFRRTPTEVAALLSTVTRRALALPGIDRVAVVGQSFGADVLPLGVSSLPPELRAHIAFVGLVVPAGTMELRASPSEIFSWGEPEIPILPFVRKLNWMPGVCIGGIAETDSLCPSVTQANFSRVMLPGGHPLHRDSATVHAVLIHRLDTALGRP